MAGTCKGRFLGQAEGEALRAEARRVGKESFARRGEFNLRNDIPNLAAKLMIEDPPWPSPAFRALEKKPLCTKENGSGECPANPLSKQEKEAIDLQLEKIREQHKALTERNSKLRTAL